jgi:hypothetical protein
VLDDGVVYIGVLRTLRREVAGRIVDRIDPRASGSWKGVAM